ncbi:MAG: fibrobacter succinogenes major paralogous domain-containing protein [Chitinispirillia bacterium]|nr:fibrobacter succinogenes major paralogous domain-containing protein [Chitinispirillia bacterium]
MTEKVKDTVITIILLLVATGVFFAGIGGLFWLYVTDRLDRIEDRLTDAAPWSAGEQFNSGIDYGSFDYEGQTYRTVKIGEQTWMAENLNVKVDNSWCYDDDGDNCLKYGRLYNWDAAMKACPAGWRLPDNADWTALIEFVTPGDLAELVGFDGSSSGIPGEKLKSKIGWKGYKAATDDYGFSAVPGGYYSDEQYRSAGEITYWWSSVDDDDEEEAYNVPLGRMYQGDILIADNKSDGNSVRCIQ